MANESKQLKILFLNAKFLPIGGTAIRTLNFARALKINGCSVRIATWQSLDEYSPKQGIRDIVREGIPINILPVNHIWLRRHFRLLYFLTLVFTYSRFVRSMVKNYNVNIVHCANETLWVGVLLRKVLKRPIIADIHAMPSFSGLGIIGIPNSLQHFIMKNTLKIACKSIDGILCPTDELRGLLISWGLQRNKMKTIPNAIITVEKTRKSKSKIRRALGIREEEALIAFHGTLFASYNVNALLHLSRISRILNITLKDRVKFLVIGNYKKVPVNDRSFIYTGYVENLSEYLSAVDFAILPIYDNSFGIRSRLMDYFANSIPVITTPVGITGMPFARESDAIIVRNTDEEIAQSAIELICSSEKVKEMAHHSGELAKNFSSDTISKKLISSYLKILRS